MFRGGKAADVIIISGLLVIHINGHSLWHVTSRFLCLCVPSQGPRIPTLPAYVLGFGSHWSCDDKHITTILLSCGNYTRHLRISVGSLQHANKPYLPTFPFYPRRLLLFISLSPDPNSSVFLPIYNKCHCHFLLWQPISDTVQCVQVVYNSKGLLIPTEQQWSYTKPVFLPKNNSCFLRKVLKERGMHFVKSASSVFFQGQGQKINEWMKSDEY